GKRYTSCPAPGSRLPMAHSWCRLAGFALVHCNIVPCRSQVCFVRVEPSHRPAQARAASRDLTSAVGGKRAGAPIKRCPRFRFLSLRVCAAGSPTANAGALALDEPDNDQEYDRADRGIDDRSDETGER